MKFARADAPREIRVIPALAWLSQPVPAAGTAGVRTGPDGVPICIHKLAHNQLRFFFPRVFDHRTPFQFGGGAFLMD
jgi:hypothetical protein